MAEKKAMISIISNQIISSGPNPSKRNFFLLPFSPQNLQFPKQRTKSARILGHSQKSTVAGDDVKTLANFKSKYNEIKVLEVSRRADHPFAGSRLLLLDSPGNIHSISFLLKHLTDTYLDVFATFPPILPSGPIGILGFGAGSAGRLILQLYPQSVIHGWELDPSVISVGREYFGLSECEKENADGLWVNIGDAMNAEVDGGFAGVLVDLFSKGSVVDELQDARSWEKIKKKLKRGGRVMVNCGGSCVEAEDITRNGDVVMEETLEAMSKVFPEILVLNVGHNKEDSWIALSGSSPDRETWKKTIPAPELRRYVDKWVSFPTIGT